MVLNPPRRGNARHGRPVARGRRCAVCADVPGISAIRSRWSRVSRRAAAARHGCIALVRRWPRWRRLGRRAGAQPRGRNPVRRISGARPPAGRSAAGPRWGPTAPCTRCPRTATSTRGSPAAASCGSTTWDGSRGTVWPSARRDRLRGAQEPGLHRCKPARRQALDGSSGRPACRGPRRRGRRHRARGNLGGNALRPFPPRPARVGGDPARRGDRAAGHRRRRNHLRRRPPTGGCTRSRRGASSNGRFPSRPRPASPSSPRMERSCSARTAVNSSRVSPAGDCDVEEALGAPVIGVAADALQIVADTAPGALPDSPSTAGSSGGPTPARTLGSPPFIAEDRVFLTAQDGSLIALDSHHAVSGSLKTSGRRRGDRGGERRDPGRRPGLDRLFARHGRDWPSPARTPGIPAPWPQSGHDARHSGRTEAAPAADNDALLAQNPDYLYLQALSSAPGRDGIQLLLADIGAPHLLPFPRQEHAGTRCGCWRTSWARD